MQKRIQTLLQRIYTCLYYGRGSKRHNQLVTRVEELADALNSIRKNSLDDRHRFLINPFRAR